VFGGLGSVSGTIMAAFTWALVLEGFLRILLPAGFETWRFVVYPLFLLVMMLLRPQGLFGGFEFPYLRQVLPKPYVPRTQEQISLVHAVEDASEGD
jgi:branched-chain amino acid transport system permease protein